MSRERRPLTGKEVQEFKQKLLEQKERLWQEIRETLLGKIGRDYQDQIRSVNEWEDLAQIDLLEETVLGVLEAQKEELEAIAQALWRIDNDEYGRCLECGKWIRYKRLQIRPWSSYCTDCKGRKEKKGISG
ncbi:MAG TPA: TraR/DksA family transcriptional regulator [Thermodesulfobacteriaceae bacterium]|nr:TraR/DksA family transcriptional regulator [Thermodesulfobacteriaceae bacterium]